MSRCISAAAASSGVWVLHCECCTVSCGRVTSKDVLYSDDTMSEVQLSLQGSHPSQEHPWGSLHPDSDECLCNILRPCHNCGGGFKGLPWESSDNLHKYIWYYLSMSSNTWPSCKCKRVGGVTIDEKKKLLKRYSWPGITKWPKISILMIHHNP